MLIANLPHSPGPTQEARRAARCKAFDDFLADDMRRHATERCLEILSEASRHIPREVKARHPKIAWRGVADFGNVLRHDYPNVKNRRVWEIVTHDLDPLKAAVANILHDLEAMAGEAP